jgi:uncharacterized protein (DUF2141 family)
MPQGTFKILLFLVFMSGCSTSPPTGSSNDAPAKFGPPKFKDAKFQLETATLTIDILVK